MNFERTEKFESLEPFNFVSFNFIKYKLNNGEIIRYYVDPEKQNLAGEGNIIMTYVDRNGNMYDAEVYFDEETNMIYPP